MRIIILLLVTCLFCTNQLVQAQGLNDVFVGCLSDCCTRNATDCNSGACEQECAQFLEGTSSDQEAEGSTSEESESENNNEDVISENGEDNLDDDIDRVGDEADKSALSVLNNLEASFRNIAASSKGGKKVFGEFNKIRTRLQKALLERSSSQCGRLVTKMTNGLGNLINSLENQECEEEENDENNDTNKPNDDKQNSEFDKIKELRDEFKETLNNWLNKRAEVTNSIRELLGLSPFEPNDLIEKQTIVDPILAILIDADSTCSSVIDEKLDKMSDNFETIIKPNLCSAIPNDPCYSDDLASDLVDLMNRLIFLSQEKTSDGKIAICQSVPAFINRVRKSDELLDLEKLCEDLQGQDFGIDCNKLQRCIPSDVLEQELSNLSSGFNSLVTSLTADSNNNDVLDVCENNELDSASFEEIFANTLLKEAYIDAINDFITKLVEVQAGFNNSAASTTKSFAESVRDGIEDSLGKSPRECARDFIQDARRIQNTKNKFKEKFLCTESNPTDCLTPEQLVDIFTLVDRMNAIPNVDDNNNKVPDICEERLD